MPDPQFPVHFAPARSILSPVTGFLREAGFTHSLSPARNCTFGCSYCYVPTLRIFGGLQPDDWTHWGQWTTYKDNAAALAARELRQTQIVYCSPLVDPYQPTEATAALMPALLETVCAHPPNIFVIQTRGPLIERDLPLLLQLAALTRLRISFSVTTDRDDVRRRYEPHCVPNHERLRVMARLRAAGLTVFAALAPILPCHPETLASQALDVTGRDLIADPLHTRTVKQRGATSREAAIRIARHWGETEWFEPHFQRSVLDRMRTAAERAGKQLVAGTAGFALLANDVALDNSFAEHRGVDGVRSIR